MVGGGYCRLQMPLKLALGVRETVAGHRLGALEGEGGGGVPPPLPPCVCQRVCAVQILCFSRLVYGDVISKHCWLGICGMRVCSCEGRSEGKIWVNIENPLNCACTVQQDPLSPSSGLQGLVQMHG